MLDDSASMSGKPWNDLMSALKNFLSQLETNLNLKDNSKVSCILYDSNAKL